MWWTIGAALAGELAPAVITIDSPDDGLVVRYGERERGQPILSLPELCAIPCTTTLPPGVHHLYSADDHIAWAGARVRVEPGEVVELRTRKVRWAPMLVGGALWGLSSLRVEDLANRDDQCDDIWSEPEDVQACELRSWVPARQYVVPLAGAIGGCAMFYIALPTFHRI